MSGLVNDSAAPRCDLPADPPAPVENPRPKVSAKSNSPDSGVEQAASGSTTPIEREEETSAVRSVSRG